MVNPRHPSWQQLPKWCYRCLGITIEQDRDIYPCDFDEDISDLDDGSEVDVHKKKRASISQECECDEDDCECESSSEDDEDSMSERSYDGSDCEYYYELKDQREDRKRELRKLEKLKEKEKEELYPFEREKEEEVQSAYDSLKKTGKEGKTVSLAPITVAGHFRLYSTDHIEYCYELGDYPTKYIEFYYLDESDQLLLDREARKKAKKIYGHIYFNGDCGCSFRPFKPPKHASLDNHTLKSDDRKYSLTIQFLSNDYLKLKVGYDLVSNDKPQPQDVPEIFDFVGIRLDVVKEREQRMASVKRKRSPSPRDSWFERTHSMGHWNQL